MSTHPMVTRAKGGIFKPLERMNCHVTTTSPLLRSHVHALRDPNWKEAIVRYMGLNKALVPDLAGDLHISLLHARPYLMLINSLQLHVSFTAQLTAYTDADWAGCPVTRRSTSVLRQSYRVMPNVIADTVRASKFATCASHAPLIYCYRLIAVINDNQEINEPSNADFTNSNTYMFRFATKLVGRITIPSRLTVLEEKIKVVIHPEYPEQTIAIGSTLTEKGRKELCALLRQNMDVFAWKPADMTGVPRHIAEHRLNVREGCLPIRQKKRGQAPERNKAIQEEVEKLVDAEIMKEVHYHSWLSNPVMVKKHDGSWRMCVDFKDLNKACPKDGYPLSEIDWKVESLCGYPFKCFLDAYKGYHQIKMAEEDEEKTSFITSQGIFYYSKMPFGLKNAGATYQRLVDKAFQKQIGRNLELKITAFLQNSEEVHKEERFLMDSGSRSSLQIDKETNRGSPNADRTKGKGRANHVLSRGQGSYQCSLNDRKGGQANASVLCEPRPTRAGDQLHPHGKTGVSLAQCKQAAEKILPGTHNYCNHRSADKAAAVKLRNHQKDAKVEI
ncbi:reverse transcriptase domain-containing protein [Tanacetum coccineum]